MPPFNNPREHQSYIRYLELISQVTEDWGKVTNSVNDFINKGRNPEVGKQALDLIQKMSSPVNELNGLLTIELKDFLQEDLEGKQQEI